MATKVKIRTNKKDFAPTPREVAKQVEEARRVQLETKKHALEFIAVGPAVVRRDQLVSLTPGTWSEGYGKDRKVEHVINIRTLRDVERVRFQNAEIRNNALRKARTALRAR